MTSTDLAAAVAQALTVAAEPTPRRGRAMTPETSGLVYEKVLG